MAILVTGGAGYIGANFIHQYLELEPKCQIIILDDLSTGEPSRISAKTIFYKGDFADLNLLKTIFTKHKIDSLVHFAAKTSVEESFEQAQIYYLENYLKTKELFDFCSSNGTKNIVFSSTAAVYASQKNDKISEQGPTKPNSPYGIAKLKAEQYLHELQKKCKDLNFIILRYFNVAGANLLKNLGPNSKASKHLFKMTAQAAAGYKTSFSIFGIDYPTRDGTCIRDFIHVMDIANVHIASLNYSKTNSECLVLNCGY
ncbi:MAG: UDP-glucose 4-epimerase GalE, partial [Bdellovibrionota bacterium]|nr:UDP-glucose 4-epimerase GalE [Bdellovibrionota bacterium]